MTVPSDITVICSKIIARKHSVASKAKHTVIGYTKILKTKTGKKNQQKSKDVLHVCVTVKIKIIDNLPTKNTTYCSEFIGLQVTGNILQSSDKCASQTHSHQSVKTHLHSIICVANKSEVHNGKD